MVSAPAMMVMFMDGSKLTTIRNLSPSLYGPLLEGVLLQPRTAGVPLLMAVTTQTLAMAWALAARTRGLPQHRMEQELFALLKDNPSSLVGRPWGAAIKTWVRTMRHWDAASLDRALHALLRADVALKETRISSDKEVFTTLILAMTIRSPRQAAA